MTNNGEITEGEHPLQDNMTFRLEFGQVSKKDEGDPMWVSTSSAPGEWFFEEEGS